MTTDALAQQLAQQKSDLRRSASARRDILAREAPEDAGERAAAVFAGHFSLTPGTVVSGYWPMGSELDPRPLLHRLHAEGLRTALPLTRGREHPLQFRAWRPGDALRPGGFGTSVPTDDAPELTPSVLLVPLLAVDGYGYRLGYGGGYYDRTLRSLRGSGMPVTAVGFAFAGQQIAAVPHHGGDEMLDWLVSERDARRFG